MLKSIALWQSQISIIYNKDKSNSNIRSIEWFDDNRIASTCFWFMEIVALCAGVKYLKTNIECFIHSHFCSPPGLWKAVFLFNYTWRGITDLHARMCLRLIFLGSNHLQCFPSLSWNSGHPHIPFDHWGNPYQLQLLPPPSHAWLNQRWRPIYLILMRFALEAVILTVDYFIESEMLILFDELAWFNNIHIRLLSLSIYE